MALIKCPNCGKDISDSAVKCVHCGTDLTAIKKQDEISKEYSVLPVEEKIRIRIEYDKINPAYLLQEKRQKKYSVVMLVLAVLFVCVLVLDFIFYLLRTFDIGNLPFEIIFIPLGLAAFIFILVAVVYFLLKSGRKRELFEQKRFVSWLKKEKNLTYNIILSDKDRVIYNSYKID